MCLFSWSAKIAKKCKKSTVKSTHYWKSEFCDITDALSSTGKPKQSVFVLKAANRGLNIPAFGKTLDGFTLQSCTAGAGGPQIKIWKRVLKETFKNCVAGHLILKTS